MKKTLHGKRYLRSRCSVQIGRDKKRYKKLMRALRLFNRAIFPSFDKFVNGMAELSKVISKSFGVSLLPSHWEDND